MNGRSLARTVDAIEEREEHTRLVLALRLRRIVPGSAPGDSAGGDTGGTIAAYWREGGNEK